MGDTWTYNLKDYTVGRLDKSTIAGVESDNVSTTTYSYLYTKFGQLKREEIGDTDLGLLDGVERSSVQRALDQNHRGDVKKATGFGVVESYKYEIASCFGLHYSSVSKIIRAAEDSRFKT